jgi:hypothetical protein
MVGLLQSLKLKARFRQLLYRSMGSPPFFCSQKSIGSNSTGVGSSVHVTHSTHKERPDVWTRDLEEAILSVAMSE